MVLIVMDTARVDESYGLLDAKSAAEESESTLATATTYRRAISSAPWTLPSHASLFTGTTPSKHGAHAGHKHLSDDLTTISEILQNQGYETVAVSNNTWISGEFGFERGFETFYKTWQYVQSNTDLGKIARQEEGVDKLKKATEALFNGNPVTNLTNAIYGQFLRKNEDDGAAQTNKWVHDWLKTRDDTRPFFLFINYIEPHLEYRPAKQHAKEQLPEGISFNEAMDVSQDAWRYIAGDVEMSEEDFVILRALYRAEIAYLFEKIESLIDMFKTAGKWEDTLFIVTSDHGENIGEHDLMDHQYALYETLLNVPLIVHGGPFGGNDIHDLVQLLDIPPTVLDVLDIDALDARKQFQGISFHPDSEATREHAVAEYLAPQPSMAALEKRVGELPPEVHIYDRTLRTIRTDRYKYIRGSDGSRELYEIQLDSDETNDIADRESKKVVELDEQLDTWLDSFKHAENVSDVSMSASTKSRLEELGYLQ
ncbi:sulfatase [Haloarcula brevis]|uniref:sulfatase n=1 Tax=Haloarcula brevis TaxID=3111453 RepID=UPI00300F0514